MPCPCRSPPTTCSRCGTCTNCRPAAAPCCAGTDLERATMTKERDLPLGARGPAVRVRPRRRRHRPPDAPRPARRDAERPAGIPAPGGGDGRGSRPRLVGQPPRRHRSRRASAPPDPPRDPRRRLARAHRALHDPETGLVAEVTYRSPDGIPVLRSEVTLRNEGRRTLHLESVSSLVVGGLTPRTRRPSTPPTCCGRRTTGSPNAAGSDEPLRLTTSPASAAA